MIVLEKNTYLLKELIFPGLMVELVVEDILGVVVTTITTLDLVEEVIVNQLVQI